MKKVISRPLSRRAASGIAGGGFPRIVSVEKIDIMTGIPGYEVKVFGVVVLRKDPIPT